MDQFDTLYGQRLEDKERQKPLYIYAVGTYHKHKFVDTNIWGLLSFFFVALIILLGSQIMVKLQIEAHDSRSF